MNRKLIHNYTSRDTKRKKNKQTKKKQLNKLRNKVLKEFKLQLEADITKFGKEFQSLT